ncbi:MAG: trigger factor [Candidatus Yanofskybacteria bacterium CG10_big_fil_rev_8_21_14_0_10_46_23]|uniref:Trigger factor n=1 Tax=Candidatus Yanofskybacteria bacterium CG10_big_fil_rev_8_21_14_0_10_46_23 TaxID=1975098 RepID=A0A2H0R4B8_9BACT|nr:MAG: trigger factor [Candidatus Yanofskybacteria bacterium CG10_big_fil_rev_8_21_14_0_10_46_23]
MNKNIVKKEDGSLALTISLGADELQGFVSQAEKNIGANLKVDGFRPGAVPPKVVRQKVDPETIKEEALNLSVQASISQVAKEENLTILDSFDFKINKNDSAELNFSVIITPLPKVTLGDYRGLEVERKKTEVRPEEIDKTIDFLRKSRATSRDIESPARRGNRLEVDFEVRLDGQIIEGGESKNHPVVLGDGRFIPGFEDKLIGSKRGETKEFSLVVPKDYYKRDLAGKALDFKVTVNRVEEIILPEINDDFAKSLGQFESLARLRENITQGIIKEKEEAERQRLQAQVIDLIASRAEAEIPSRLVEIQLDTLLSRFDQRLHQQGMELSLYLAQTGKTLESLRKEWRSQAERQVKDSLVLRAIREEEKIEVLEEAVTQRVNEILGQFRSIEEAERSLDLKTLRDRIRDQLAREAVIAFLEKKTKFIPAGK